MDQVYEQKYLKYKQKYLNLKYKLKGSGPKELRDECFKKCVYPRDYDNLTYGPEVKAKWDVWHQCYEKCKNEYHIGVRIEEAKDAIDKQKKAIEEYLIKREPTNKKEPTIEERKEAINKYNEASKRRNNENK